MKQPVHPPFHPSGRSGFSFFEMLMCIAVLGVILGLTVPMLGNSDAIYAARDRRNAQELSATSMMAQAAGLNFVQDDNVLDTVRAIVRGGMPVRGSMKGRIFVVPGLSDEDIKAAAKYLNIQNGELRYTTTESMAQAGNQRL